MLIYADVYNLDKQLLIRIINKKANLKVFFTALFSCLSHSRLAYIPSQGKHVYKLPICQVIQYQHSIALAAQTHFYMSFNAIV